ncbi:HNH endonuclease [Paucidesulfovibrio gracilis DSM 16080]|uniref:HNH endonuclease n=1 Tax=Paucidesulfovibrio gracilis DSM 16080 TaxID=1121449 RepID=A0A1T4W1U9_9BACT|nr:HNH endonuclease signature motif containing protein [Paucidesulfovibrio gracilis]SKA71240.1 HNH endonuclease [Paucidesulfovibrio gracilis DSM 16080]
MIGYAVLFLFVVNQLVNRLWVYTKNGGSHESELFRACPDLDPVQEEEGVKVAKDEKPTIKRTKTQAESSDIQFDFRYDILKRDNFKCVICGRSPATDFNCKLHIDYIKPWSKGGLTVPENLQTLCDACNLGKGAKV